MNLEKNKTKQKLQYQTLLRRPHVNKGAAKGSVQIQTSKSTNKKYNIYVLHVNVNIYHFIYFYLPNFSIITCFTFSLLGSFL